MAQTPSSGSKNLINFTVKLAPSQLRYLESLAPALGATSQQSALREVLEQFQSWFRLPVYQREALQKELAAKKISILQYIQELLARHFEEIREAIGKPAPAAPSRSIPATAEPLEPFAIRIAPTLLAYADQLKPQLKVSTTADVIREIVSQLQEWFELPRYQAVRLQQEMEARGLHIVEYIQETLAKRYEALRDEFGSSKLGGRR
jgi:GAF domain-containing protein